MNNVYVSENACAALKDWLCDNGYRVKEIKAGRLVYPAISAHPDIYMCRLGMSAGAPLLKAGDNELGYSYPKNVPYNALCLDKYFIHNLKYTSERLKSAARDAKLQMINVKQGYTKCSIAAVDGSSVITSDEGIARTLEKYSDINVLRIRPGYVDLPGFECGFIGGASGRVGDKMLFNGDLSAHPDFKDICGFIEARGIEPVYFKGFPLEDIGSVIESEF